MRLSGPGSDLDARQFVLDNSRKEVGNLYPPDLFVFSPERELLGQLSYNATAEETMRFLRGVLAARPDLAPATDPVEDLRYDLGDPMQSQLAVLESRWQDGEREALIEPLQIWLEQHGEQWDHGAATAWMLAGNAFYHRGDYDRADDCWRTVVERYPNHPLRHRAKHNMLDATAWHMPHHQDIRGARHPKPGDKRVVDPQPEIREKNLEFVASNPSRYRTMPSGLPLVKVPGGTFTMGGQPAVFPRELPLRQVTISRPFLMSAWPITVGLWRRFRPDDFPEPKDPLALFLPVVRVTREEAMAFCDFLSSVDGLTYRLPTEAEWEYAARGGLEGAEYPWGNEDPDETLCNYKHSPGVPVASYPANRYGLFDMVGNCCEWVADKYMANAYALTPPQVNDPTGPTEEDGWKPIVGGSYVIRGGYTGIEFSRLMVRNALRLTANKAGLRVASSLT